MKTRSQIIKSRNEIQDNRGFLQDIVQNIEITENITSHFRMLFTSIFKDVTKGAKSNDLVRVTVQSPSLDYPIVNSR